MEWQLHHHSVERQLHKYYGKVHYGNTVLLYSHMEVFSLLGNFSSSLLSSGPGANPDAVMEQIKAQLAQAYAQEFLETVGNKCFDKCVTKPGSSLSGSESSCISRCVDRYIEATGIVSRALFSSQR